MREPSKNGTSSGVTAMEPSISAAASRADAEIVATPVQAPVPRSERACGTVPQTNWDSINPNEDQILDWVSSGLTFADIERLHGATECSFRRWLFRYPALKQRVDAARKEFWDAKGKHVKDKVLQMQAHAVDAAGEIWGNFAERAKAGDPEALSQLKPAMDILKLFAPQQQSGIALNVVQGEDGQQMQIVFARPEPQEDSDY